MICLALEWSSPLRSVAVATSDGILAQASCPDPRASSLFALIEEALGLANVARQAIDTVAVGLGPGSYTGIRSALAAAQGWHLATGCRLLGLGSSEVSARQCHKLGLRGRVLIATDAQRGEFYWETFELAATSVASLKRLRLGSRETLLGDLADGVRPIRTHPGILESTGETIPPDAGVLAEWAVSSGLAHPALPLEPIYLRPTAFVKAPPTRSGM